MGDAAATAHFSIGSGTRLALDSAIALATYLHSEPTLDAAFAQYQNARRLDVLRLQSAARNSMEWFEEIERYFDLDPVQFTYSLLTRSQRISHENLRLRDEDWLNGAEALVPAARAGVGPNAAHPPPDVRPLHACAAWSSRTASSSRRWPSTRPSTACPTDWHLVHLGERAKGGAGLVYTEMTCVTPEGRITPGCPGTYSPEAEAAWKRIVDFVHAETDAKICLPARPRRRQGLDPARLGRARRARSPTATGRSSRSPRSPGRPRTRPRRRWTAPTWTASATPSSKAPAMADALRLRHARAAHGPRLPALGLHHAR